MGSGSSARSKRRSAAPHPLQQSHHATTTTRPELRGQQQQQQSLRATPQSSGRADAPAAPRRMCRQRRLGQQQACRWGRWQPSRRLFSQSGAARRLRFAAQLASAQSPSPASAIPGGAALPLMRRRRRRSHSGRATQADKFPCAGIGLHARKRTLAAPLAEAVQRR